MLSPQWIKAQCEQHLNQPVQLQMNGHENYQGVIEHVDDQNVYLLIPSDENGQYMDVKEAMQWNQQQWGNASQALINGKLINVIIRIIQRHIIIHTIAHVRSGDDLYYH
ncbi:hypothetical protein [Bacillus sp. JCM 19034]|uniref:hypothetical protein n=1 Tax=Bacillus sp. JCM 19034 TaxID=1481928 RepID=UPI000781127A|nr:hypothetical protein [Bacillus sp. JCM 19034]